MKNYLKEINLIGIVPVIKIDDVADALPLAKALVKGGLPVAEVTFRTKHAKEAMSIISKELPEMLVGAGTVITTEQVDDAIEAGAKFIVSPGLNPTIVKYCQEKNILVLPGCANASDIETAISLGLETVKFFPAEPLGGLNMIKALAAPYVNVKFMPTGGINPGNVRSYLAFDKIVACGGTWMIDNTLIANKEFDKIEQLTREAVHTMLNLKLDHIGINSTPDLSLGLAEEFSAILGGAIRPTSKSYFAAEQIEVMTTDPNKGANGHISISTSSVDRAVYYFESLGYEFDEESATYDSKGNRKFIYFKKHFGGFGIHLVQK